MWTESRKAQLRCSNSVSTKLWRSYLRVDEGWLPPTSMLNPSYRISVAEVALKNTTTRCWFKKRNTSEGWSCLFSSVQWSLLSRVYSLYRLRNNPPLDHANKSLRKRLLLSYYAGEIAITIYNSWVTKANMTLIDIRHWQPLISGIVRESSRAVQKGLGIQNNQ